MKTFTEFLKRKIMYYRHVLTYNFSDNDTRSSFIQLVENFGYLEAKDQSTYLLPFEKTLNIEDICDAIIEWSDDSEIYVDHDDFVQIFHLYLTKEEGRNIRKIAVRNLGYDNRTKGLKNGRTL